MSTLLDQLLAALRQQSASLEIALSDGRTIGERQLLFRWHGDADLSPGQRGQIHWADRRSPCRIANVTSEHLTLQFEDDSLPEHPSTATLHVRDPFRHRLIERLEAIRRQPNHAAMDLVAQAFEPPSSTLRLLSPLTPEPWDCLNEHQQIAYTRALRERLLYIWGPPGTGKTTVISAILATAVRQGKRVLLCSTTNAAVDQALERIIALVPEHLHRTILRIGQPCAETRAVLKPFTYAARVEEPAARWRAELDTLHTERLALEAKLSRIEDYQVQQHAIDALIVRRNQIQSALVLTDAQLAMVHDLIRRREAEQIQLTRSWLKRFRHHRITELSLELPRHRLRALELRATAASLRAEHDEVNAQITRLSQATPACPEPVETAETLTTQLTQILERIRTLTTALRRLARETLDRAHLIGATLNAAATNRLITNRQFDLVLVDEASMASLPQLFAALYLTTEQIILVGDPLQLQPIGPRQSHVDACLSQSIYHWTGLLHADHSLIAPLSIQYRLHPTIAALPGHLYRMRGLAYRTAPGVREELHDLVSRHPFPHATLVWLDTGSTHTIERDAGQSPSNRFHARLAIDLAEQWATNVSTPTSVAIMSPYRAQVRLIRQLAETAALPASVRVGTIHQFQGQQADLVILDTTIADRLATSFLCRESETFSAETLLNVALTRGRAKVIVLGSAEAVQALPAETFLKTVFRHLQRDGLIVDVDRLWSPESADTQSKQPVMLPQAV